MIKFRLIDIKFDTLQGTGYLTLAAVANMPNQPLVGLKQIAWLVARGNKCFFILQFYTRKFRESIHKTARSPRKTIPSYSVTDHPHAYSHASDPSRHPFPTASAKYLPSLSSAEVIPCIIRANCQTCLTGVWGLPIPQENFPR